jgi:hypothetical protein
MIPPIIRLQILEQWIKLDMKLSKLSYQRAGERGGTEGKKTLAPLPLRCRSVVAPLKSLTHRLLTLLAAALFSLNE